MREIYGLVHQRGQEAAANRQRKAILEKYSIDGETYDGLNALLLDIAVVSRSSTDLERLILSKSANAPGMGATLDIGRMAYFYNHLGNISDTGMLSVQLKAFRNNNNLSQASAGMITSILNQLPQGHVARR
jgi:hypothetical protein